MNTQTARAAAVAINDARLDGTITRDQWLVNIALLNADMVAAGIAWEDIQ